MGLDFPSTPGLPVGGGKASGSTDSIFIRVALDLGLGSPSMEWGKGGEGSSAKPDMPTGATSAGADAAPSSASDADIAPSATATLFASLCSGGRQSGSPAEELPVAFSAATRLLSRHRYTAAMMKAARATAITATTAMIIIGSHLKPCADDVGVLSGAG